MYDWKSGWVAPDQPALVFGQYTENASASVSHTAESCKSKSQISLGLGSAARYGGPSNSNEKAVNSSLLRTPGGSQAKVVPIASLNPYQSK